MFARAKVMQGNFGTAAGPGTPVLSQLVPATNAVAGAAVTLTANQIISGWLQRTPDQACTDTFPTVDSIISAMNSGGVGPQVGDSFKLIFQNLAAFAITYAAGTGFVSGVGTLNVAASVIRTYLITLLSTKNTVSIPGVTTTSGNKFLTNISAANLATIMPGMAVTGTGIGASALVVGVSPDNGTCTVDVNSTATADNITVTFNPRARIDSLGVKTA